MGINTNGKKKTGLQMMAFTGLMAALMCVVGPLSVPLPFTAVPISFTNLVIYFAIYMLGMKAGTISYIVYFMLGLVGLPVFSGFTGGFGKVAGPTGGYLLGFILLALICGVFVEKFHGNRFLYAIGMLIGLASAYALGTVWLAYQSGLSFGAALWAGVIPFLPGDAVKIVIISLMAAPARRLISRAIPDTGRD